MKSNEERIRDCLIRAGLFSLPVYITEDLESYGMDSLIKVMSVIEIEKEFKVRIQVHELDKNPLKSLQNYIELISEKIRS